MTRTCDYHRSEPIEAEIERVATTPTKRITYTVLRCPECNRVRGVRRTVAHLAPTT